MRGGATEHPLADPERGLDGIEGDRTYDRDAHATTPPAIGSEVITYCLGIAAMAKVSLS
jgi:hypothetical protein